MMSSAEIREAMKDRRVAYVAAAIGVHNQTIYSILNDTSHNPKEETLRKLSAYFAEREAK